MHATPLLRVPNQFFGSGETAFFCSHFYGDALGTASDPIPKQLQSVCPDTLRWLISVSLGSAIAT